MKFRPRFSVRTLAIFVTLVCVYFAAWGPTNKFAAGIGIPGYTGYGAQRPPNVVGPRYSITIQADAPLPLVIGQDDIDYDETTKTFKTTRRYYLWLFGPKINFPFESTWEHPIAARKQKL